MKIRTFVIPYVNPDLDGIAAAVGMSVYLRLSGTLASAAYFGRLDAESEWALAESGEIVVEKLSFCPTDSSYVLVDTHHINQIPIDIPLDSVIEVVDHHPAGNPDAFPNARIQNEMVGAAATLVTERIRAGRLAVPSSVARLLGLGILSNTINFTAPSTDPRDSQAFDFLTSLTALSRSDWIALRTARSAHTKSQSVTDQIAADVKTFYLAGKGVVISQVEPDDVGQFVANSDISDALDLLRVKSCATYALLNVIDVQHAHSFVFCSDQQLATQLANLLAIEHSEKMLTANRILLRKTDLLPALAKLEDQYRS